MLEGIAPEAFVQRLAVQEAQSQASAGRDAFGFGSLDLADVVLEASARDRIVLGELILLVLQA